MKSSILALTSLIAGNASAFVVRPSAFPSKQLLFRDGGSAFATPALATSAATVRYMSSESENFVNAEIGASDVVVFSKTYCPFCTATKTLMKDLKVNAKVIELDEIENGSAIQDALKDLTGQRTVPNVFIKGEHLGGNDATQAAAKSGKLQELLGR